MQPSGSNAREISKIFFNRHNLQVSQFKRALFNFVAVCVSTLNLAFNLNFTYYK